MSVVIAIIPVFAVVMIGLVARRRGFISRGFIDGANRLVFCLAIPAMIFRSVSKIDIKIQFNMTLISVTLLSVIAVFFTAWAASALLKIDRKRYGAFIQSSFHGNLGYIGFAVAYYSLGSDGLAKAGIIAGFIMILQNVLAVIALNLHADSVFGGRKSIRIFYIFSNPVIVAAVAGIFASLVQFETPVVIGRTLDILSGLALPAALLTIGASLSFKLFKANFADVMPAIFIKLIIMPGLGLLSYLFFDIGSEDYLPGLILLSSPSATVAYVMAKEMKGDADFAAVAISASSLASIAAYSVWINIGMRL